MNLERGRCLFAFVILTGFLLGTAYGLNDTTMAPTTTPATTQPMTTAGQAIDSLTTVLSTTISPTTPVETTNTTTEITDSVMTTKSVMTSFEATTAVEVTNTTVVTDSVTMTEFVTSSETTMADLSTGNNDTAEVTGPTEVMTEIVTEIVNYSTNAVVPTEVTTENVTEIVNSSTTMITNSLATLNVTTAAVDVDECSPNPCMNDGICTDETNGYTCNCTGTGFNGTNCETIIDECSSNPCVNGGTCTDETNGYTCNCAGTGYGGPNCAIDVDECTGNSNPCMNGGNCTNMVPGYMCNCVLGYTGMNCESDINECTGNSNPCVNGGTCYNMVPGYMCNCVSGYTGMNCESDINECNGNPNPCMNGGTCNNMMPGYMCNCVLGYTGMNCETDIDDCDNHNCTNGGSCNDLVNGYECLCPPGFNGTYCEIDIDACDPNPCFNEANCTNHVMSTGDATYTCYCMPGWTGTNCTDDFRECESTPCFNNGTCYEGTNYYNCTCAPGFNGTYCENKCPPGTFGYYCEESCTCVAAANCSNVDGSCTCDQEVCDKSELQVIAFRSADSPISKDENFTLACEVNLVGEDLEEVSWFRDGMKLPDTSNKKYEIKTDRDMGEYNITIRSAGAEDTGNYICTAVTAGNQFTNSSDVIGISVVVPGMIDLALSKQNDSIQLNQTASLNCTVFSSSDNASIDWERNGERLLDDADRTNITEGQQDGTGGIYFFSFLEISDIMREDNGVYTCVALNGAGNSTDRADFNIFVQEVAELANASYVSVLSEQLSLDWDFIIQGNAELNCNATYTIQGTNQTEQQAVGGSPPAVVRNLVPYTTYEFQLTCVNLVGTSLPLVYPSQRTLAGKPSRPRNVQIGDPEATRVSVSWEKPLDPNGPIDRYEVIATGGSAVVQERFDGNANRGTLENLTPYVSYSLTVQAVNLDGGKVFEVSDPSSPPVRFTTLQDVPGSPFNPLAREEGGGCRVTWGEPEEPNGVITGYTLYTEIRRRDTNEVTGTLGMYERGPNQREVIFDETDLQPYSFFNFSVTASTIIGEGTRARTQEQCETPQGVPVEPPPLPTPAETAVSQTSFTTTLPPYDERSGPVSCYEVIVVQLESAEAGRNLDSSDPSYGPSYTKSHLEAKDGTGIPYRAMVFNKYSRPSNDELVIGATTEDVTNCNTGDAAGSGRRRRRETQTTAGLLTATNGPLNTGGIYSSFVRVYTPSEEQSDPKMVFYESGPFMAPVKLKEYSNTGAIVGGIFGVLIALALVSVILLMLYRRKKDMAGDPLMTPTSNGPRENGNGTLIGMENLGIEDEMVVEPIKLERLEKAIREKAKDEKKVFWDEYKALPNRPPPMVTMNSSNHPANKDKNRYINIIAYDHTRVKLKHVDGIEGSDYINASYVNGYQSPDKFIAAQGPKDNTLEDFWRMIWECNCSTIVMLTKCVEDGKDKCSQYWPNTGSVKYGRFEVKLDEVKETAEYVIRSFFLSENDKETGQRSITQFHFLGWPDHGQPDYPNPMLCLIKRVRHLTSKMNHRANIVVHCSAGVGRTGTYIVIDAMLDKMKHEKQVDIYNFIHEIRQQRNTLVQSFVQYFFIHIALLEEHLFGHMDVGMSDFPAYYQQLSNKSDYNEDLTRLEEEFRRACKLGVNGTEQTYANIDQNKDKNRIGHILPFDKNIVKLERLIGEEFSDYINASYITGYDRKNMYIATQGPLPNTIADFWRMIWESQTSTIVMLTETTEKGHEMCAQYWPLEVDEVEEHGNISVTLIDESDEDEAFTVRDIEISHAQVMQNIYGNIDKEGEGPTEAADSPEGESAYGNVPDSPPPTPMKDIRKIRQYHFRGWPEVGVPDTGIDLMRLVNKSHLHQKERGAHPIVVHCSAGAGRTGVFIGLNILMSRMEEESMIDVFQTVRGLRQQRPHMVQDLAQYKFCYLAMVEYIQDQSTEYQNFVPRV